MLLIITDAQASSAPKIKAVSLPASSAAHSPDLKKLQEHYESGDRESVLTELRKSNTLQKGPLCFYALWYKATTTGDTKDVTWWESATNFSNTFFAWLMERPSQTAINIDQICEALLLHFQVARKRNEFDPWNAREYPTPFGSISTAQSMNFSQNLLNFLLRPTTAERFPLNASELYHLILILEQKCEGVFKQQKPGWICNILEKMIHKLSQFNLDDACELSFYCKQLYPKTNILELMTAQRNKGNLNQLVFYCDPSSARYTPYGHKTGQYEAPQIVQDVIAGKFSPVCPIEADRTNGFVEKGIVLGNAHALATVEIYGKRGETKAFQYFSNGLDSGNATDRGLIQWFGETFSGEETPEDQNGKKTNNDFQDFCSSFESFGRGRCHRTGPKTAKNCDSPATLHKETPEKINAGHVWKEALRVSRETSPKELSAHELFYEHKEGSRVHFVVTDETKKSIAAFTLHMKHENVDRQITETREQLIAFGLKLHEQQTASSEAAQKK